MTESAVAERSARLGTWVLAATLVPLAGCYQHYLGSPAPGTDGGAGPTFDAGPERDAGDGPIIVPPVGPTVFVIHRLAVAPPTPDGRGPGANLDGMDSGGGIDDPRMNCERRHPDLVSATDLVRGIDNAYASLVPTAESLTGIPLNEAIAAAIARGELLILVELRGPTLDRVELNAALAAEPLVLSGDGRLAPGQRFLRIETIGQGTLRTTAAGRFVASLDQLNAQLSPELALVLPLERLTRVELRFNRDASGLRAGEIGGAAAVEDMVAQWSSTMPGIDETVRAVLESVADVEPSPGDPTLCRQIGFGATFEAVPAVAIDP